ncbi:MAG: N-acetylmuramoyl-L-alanine amidase [Clostridia bacterium]|nr:N-acetylmuramoyl-L-alanine amidase [Clostridia bacterium]
MKIFLDPGHNYSGSDTGAGGFGLREEIVTFEVANKLRELLQSAGHEVRMSRNYVTDNVGNGTIASSLNERVSMSNSWRADLFVSIHCNAFNGAARGTETLVYSKGSDAAEIAQRVQTAIVNNLGTADRGVKARSELAVLKNTMSPALLVELAFIDNEDDAWFLKTRQEDFAKAIFEGITGERAGGIAELTDIHDIAWEYAYRGIVEDLEGFENEMRQNPNGRLYWLARKTLQFIRERNF